MAGGPGRLDPGEERVSVAVEGEVDQARTLPLVSPLRQRVSRERERKWTWPVASVAASASAFCPREHQDPAVGRVLDDGGHQAIRAEAHVAVVVQRTGGGGERGAVMPRTSGTGGPGSRPRPSPP